MRGLRRAQTDGGSWLARWSRIAEMRTPFLRGPVSKSLLASFLAEGLRGAVHASAESRLSLAEIDAGQRCLCSATGS